MVKKGSILIVDDKPSVLSALELLLDEEFERVLTLNHPKSLISTLRENEIDVVLLDMNYTSGQVNCNEGIYWLKEIKAFDRNIEVVLFTAFGDVEVAVKALKLGACDFILKPWENTKLIATLKSALKLRLSRKKVDELTVKTENLKNVINLPKSQLIGQSVPMLKVKELISKVAPTDANILITGENGTGKEVVAQEIHKQSNRNNELLVTVDISALPESLIESELFGHVKGAFTDAKEDRVGKFQLAHKGTLFLDEIGNIPIAVQSKILVALQTRSITPVGSNRSVPVDIRLISATNTLLVDLIEKQMFREDLYYRINTINIQLPPLRDRNLDIAILAHFFKDKFAHKYRRHNIKISASAIKMLENHPWPGNVRELEHAIEKAIILNDTNQISGEEFGFTKSDGVKKDPLSLEEMEKQLIFKTLDKHDGNFSTAAKQLGITRQTLYNKLKRYDK